jgi:hypothetical protein
MHISLLGSLVLLATASAVLPAFAQEADPKIVGTLPEPTSSFCYNNSTGVLRLVLADQSGNPKPCHRNESPISFADLQALAAGSQPTDPVSTPFPDSLTTPTP